MKYTQEQLEGMSDQGINFLVLKYENYCVTADYFLPGCEDTIDYCNNPSDIMPIAIENKIGIEPYYEWQASHDADDGKYIESFHKNPYRAIAIVYLMMKQGEVDPEVLNNAAEALKGDE